MERAVVWSEVKRTLGTATDALRALETTAPPSAAGRSGLRGFLPGARTPRIAPGPSPQALEMFRSAVIDALAALAAAAEDVGRRVAELDWLEHRVSELRLELTQHERRLTELTPAVPAAGAPAPRPSAAPHARRFDTLYAAFEDRFRGTREEIMRRARTHLPAIRAAGAGRDGAAVVDIGSGRGEWLEVLREEGLQARGVDVNRVFVQECRQRGLDIEEADALDHLRSLPDGALGAVTAFHVAEHLRFDDLVALLDESIRVLRSGGVVLLETPNPSNVQVGSADFYLDPTHRHPLPSAMLKFLVEARGFVRVEVVNLHPYPDSLLVRGGGVADRFNAHFYGPQDYAVLGWRP